MMSSNYNGVLCPINTANADVTRLSNWVASAVWTEFVTSSRRPPTDSVDNLETDQTDSIAAWLCGFWSTLTTFWTMTSLCRHLSPTTIARRHCKLGQCHDYRRVRLHRRRDSTRQLSGVGIGGVYWALIASCCCCGCWRQSSQWTQHCNWLVYITSSVNLMDRSQLQ